MMEKSFLPRGTLLFLLVIGFAIRLYDLTDPPLDFHPVRQLRAAMIARGMYYAELPTAPEWQREIALRQWKGLETLEPPVMERLVSLTYRALGREVLWVARIFSSAFWVLGALALYFLASRLTSRDGALLAAAFALFLPFGVVASRSFQPDPLMVALSFATLAAFYAWFVRGEPDWVHVVGVGLLGGAALFVKPMAAFFVFGGLTGMVLASGDLRARASDAKYWVLVALILAPAAGYFFLGKYVNHRIGLGIWDFFRPSMVTSPRFYMDWQAFIVRFIGSGALAAAIIGTFAYGRVGRGMMLGLWGGYLLFGLAFPYHITTHSYYSLPLVMIVAAGLAPIGSAVFARLAKKTGERRAWRLAALLAVGLVLLMPLREARGVLAGKDYRSQVGYWERLGRLVKHSNNLLELSHDYGYRLEYYGWTNGSLWPVEAGDQVDEAELQARLEGRSFFVITLLGELEKQPTLKSYLYETYPVYESGDDFVIFDLRAGKDGGAQ